MIRASADVGWSTAGTPSAWRWPKPASYYPILPPCWAGSPATTPRRCTRATPSTVSCTSNPPSRQTAAGDSDCGRWSTLSATRRTSHAKSWIGILLRCSSNGRGDVELVLLFENFSCPADGYRTRASTSGSAARTMVIVNAASDWASSGLAYLTGPTDGTPDFSCAAVLAEARRVNTDIAALLGVEVDAAAMLAGRAAILCLTRLGCGPAGGASRRAAPPDCCPPPMAGVLSLCRARTTSRHYRR